MACRACGSSIPADGTEEADWAELCGYCDDSGLSWCERHRQYDMCDSDEFNWHVEDDTATGGEGEG